MIHVAAAVIYNAEGRILIARRREGKSQAGMWEFPGGKLEEGENICDCLRRELVEEMDIEVEPYAFFGENEHAYGALHIRLTAWKARYVGGVIRLTDHDDFRWEEAGRLEAYPFAAADVPFVRKLVLESRAGEERSR